MRKTKIFLLILILVGLIFISACKKNKEIDPIDIYKCEIELLDTLLNENNDVYYNKEDIMQDIRKVYIDNEMLLVMGRVIKITDINALLQIKNVRKIDSNYVVTFPMEDEKFVIICNKYGIVDNMFLFNNQVMSSKEFLKIKDNSRLNEIVQQYGFVHSSIPYIMDEEESNKDNLFYEVVFSDGKIGKINMEYSQDVYQIASKEILSVKISKKVMKYLCNN